MFLTFFLLIISTFLGFKASYFFVKDKATKIEALFLSYIFGLVIASYSILFIALIIKDLKIAVFLYLAIAGIISATLIKWKDVPKFIKKLPAEIKNLHFSGLALRLKKIPYGQTIFLLIMILLFLNPVLKTLVFENNSYKTTAPGYGDIPFHMTQISYFIHNQPFSLENPIYVGQNLSYPFLINLLSAIFYILNGNYVFSFHLPSLSLVVAGIVLFYLLISRIVKKFIAATSAFLILFLGSGLGFIKILEDSHVFVQKNLPGLFNYILHLPYSIVVFYDAKYPNQNNIWSGFLTMFLMHQRTFFFGFALAAVCLFVIYLAYKNKERKLFYFSGALIGLLPLVHIHAFISLYIVLFSFFIGSLMANDKKLTGNSLRAALTAGIVALPAVIFFFFNKISEHTSGFIVFRLGWMTESGIGGINYNPTSKIHFAEYLSFLWQNFGIILPLLIIASLFIIFKNFAAKKISQNEEGIIYYLTFSALAIWLFINIIKFQPWDFDNNKFFGYFLMLACIVIGYFFKHLNFRGAKLLMLFLTFIAIATGLVDALSRSSLANPPLYQIFGQEEIKAADWITINIPHNIRILTSGTHLNIANSLAGKPVLMGYGGWLWTHGINYTSRENEIRDMFQGVNINELTKKYDIGYVLIGPSELSDFNANEKYFADNFSITFQNSEYRIYDVRNFLDK